MESGKHYEDIETSGTQFKFCKASHILLLSSHILWLSVI